MKALLIALILASAGFCELAHAAYAFVGGSTSNNTASGTTASVGYSTHAGDLLVVPAIYFHHDAVSVTLSDTAHNAWTEVL